MFAQTYIILWII